MSMSASVQARDLRHVPVRKKLMKRILCNWQLYLFLLPTIAYFLIFRYYPMLGLQIAFRKYKGTMGIWGSPWVGWKNFQDFFNTPAFKRVLPNTLAVSVGTLLISFPVPVILALLLNQLPSKRYKKLVQTTLYAPHFISTVVMVGIITLFFALKSGIVNHILELLGMERIHFMGEASWFRPLYIGSEIWQSAGWGSILYLAALSSINPELHEAAVMDGANKFQRVWHIDIPGILPTIVIMFIAELIRKGSDGFLVRFRRMFIMGMSVVPSGLYIIWLNKRQFADNTQFGEEHEIVFGLGPLLNYERPWAALLFGITFAIAVFALNLKKFRDTKYKFALYTFVIGTLQWATISETGTRSNFGNFSWGRMFGCYFITLTACAVFLEMYYNRDFFSSRSKRTTAMAVIGLILAASVICQLYHFYLILTGHGYMR